MELQQIRYILAIAEEKNITKAAEKLFVSQSALSQQLLKLEQELGTPLFERGGRILELTEAGRIYVNTAEAVLNVEKSYLEEEEQYDRSTPVIRIAVSKEVPVQAADRMIAAAGKKLDMRNTRIFYACQEDGSEMNRLLLENMADIVIGACDKAQDSGIEIITQESEQFLFLYWEKATNEGPIRVWLSPESWQRRRLEEEALRSAGIRASVVGTSELPLTEAAQRMSACMFFPKSQLGKHVCSTVGFTQQFAAKCLKKNG